MACVACELVIAVCTLVHLFNLQQTLHSGQDRRTDGVSTEMALGFLSLGFTVATLVVMVLGTDKIARSGRTVWARVSGNLGATVPHDGGATKLHSDVNTSVGGMPVDVDDTEHEGQAMGESVSVVTAQLF